MNYKFWIGVGVVVAGIILYKWKFMDENKSLSANASDGSVKQRAERAKMYNNQTLKANGLI